MSRIFVVEDEPKLAAALRTHLTRYGHEVVVSQRLGDLKSEFVEVAPDLVLLDVNLPWYDGFYWCRQFRTVSNAPIVFITARSGDMDQVLALENGADDYIVKPFSLELVTAKVRAALRRAYGEYSARSGADIAVEHAGLSYSPQRLQATLDGRRVELSRNEGLLLEALLRAGGAVVRRESLLQALWDDEEFVDDNTLTVNVNRLRRKLSDLGAGDVIRTIRGEGYAVADPGPAGDGRDG